jgi:pilus assembly protein CpaB
MRKSVLLFAIIAIGLAGGTVYFVQQWLKAERAAMSAQNKQQPAKVTEKPKPKTYVLIAAQPLPAGTFIKAGDVRWQLWPDAQVPPQFVRQQAETALNNKIPANLIGGVVRQGIAAGEPIVKEGIVGKGEHGFLAAVLTQGMRAVSIKVDDATGIAGLVFPGDRVDVILTHETTTKVGDEQVSNKVSETIIVNVRVLAIDQRTDDLKGKPTRAKTVTLEVTPHQAEVVAVATRMGSLTLSLRSLPKQEPKASVMRKDTDGKTASTDAKSKDRRDVASNCVPGTVGCKEAIPHRGNTYTIDREFSRFLSRTKKDDNINVIRGDKAESVNPYEGVKQRKNGANKKPVRTSTTNTTGEK